MISWIGRHCVTILVWMLSISWLFHIYLLAQASFRGDTVARNWELVIIMTHHVVMLGLFVISYRRRKHDGSL